MLHFIKLSNSGFFFSYILGKLNYNTKYRDPHRDLFLQCYISSNLLCFFSNTIQQCRDPHRDMKRREECEICGEIVWVRSSWSQLFCIFDFYLFSSTYKYIAGRSSQSGPADSSSTQLFFKFLISISSCQHISTKDIFTSGGLSRSGWDRFKRPSRKGPAFKNNVAARNK